MASLDEIFYKEFNQMMHSLQGIHGKLNINDIPLPDEGRNKFFVEQRELVVMSEIQEEYYSKLNGTEALLWGHKSLSRRKFDHKGEFLMKDGHYIVEDVNLPHDCIAVISKISIGVPNKFKSKEGFQYVDMISKEIDGVMQHRFVYIIPRKYCYKLNQTALVLSWNKMKVFYTGLGIALQNGQTLFMYVIPYKPSKSPKPYRVIQTKTSDDYSEEFVMLRDFWLRTNFMFDPSKCELIDAVKGRQNMAIEALPATLDMYERFDYTTNLAHEETLDEVDFI